MKKEVSLLRPLSHPNIVKYYQTDITPETQSIDVLLEYIPGGSLKSLLCRYGALEAEVIKNYAKQLLEGLSYLHSNKIVHRDLKAANILIASNGLLKLTDFGSSRRFEDIENGLSKSLKGSPYWMAPEVVARTGHSYSADIWSFGCVIIEMATGKPPWSNYSNDTWKVLELILKENSLPDFPQGDAEMLEVISKCLQRNPENRPSTRELKGMKMFSLEIDDLI
jgi:mitogen-activated protein kinase kinase kinase ANP1